MMRVIRAIAVAALTLAVMPATSRAAPMGPLPPGVTEGVGSVTKAWWGDCWRDPAGRCFAAAAGTAPMAASIAGDFTSLTQEQPLEIFLSLRAFWRTLATSPFKRVHFWILFEETPRKSEPGKPRAGSGECQFMFI